MIVVQQLCIVQRMFYNAVISWAKFRLANSGIIEKHSPFYAPVSFHAAVNALELVLEAVLVWDWLFTKMHWWGVRLERVSGTVAGGERSRRARHHTQRQENPHGGFTSCE